MNANEIKQMVLNMGADLCGIASIDRFADAPNGFHPLDVLPGCKSVIVFAKRFLAGTLKSNSTIPYTIVRNVLSDRLDKMSVALCEEMEKQNIVAIPTGTIGPSEYDAKTGRTRNIVSAKHAAAAAGLGVIGKNSLLITPEYGNMVWLTVVLTEAELEADPMLENTFCSKKCHICIDACPSHAISADNPEMQQNICWEYAFGEPEEGGEWRIKCFKCRTSCPHCFGSVNSMLINQR
ncbi:MAG: epoxyqueuosine reductase [Clostridia bacterium]|nr:epoxyqueuosine reductase [Clostridia bacterium]